MLLNNANKSDGLANRSACKDNAARSRPTRFFRLVIKMATIRKTPCTQFSKSFPDWCFSKMMKYCLKSRSHLFKSSKSLRLTKQYRLKVHLLQFPLQSLIKLKLFRLRHRQGKKSKNSKISATIYTSCRVRQQIFIANIGSNVSDGMDIIQQTFFSGKIPLGQSIHLLLA